MPTKRVRRAIPPHRQKSFSSSLLAVHRYFLQMYWLEGATIATSVLLKYLVGVATLILARFAGGGFSKGAEWVLLFCAFIGAWLGWSNKSRWAGMVPRAVSFNVAGICCYFMRKLAAMGAGIFLSLPPETAATLSDAQLFTRWAGLAVVGCGGAFFPLGWAMGNALQHVESSSRCIFVSMCSAVILFLAPSLVPSVLFYPSCVGPSLGAATAAALAVGSLCYAPQMHRVNFNVAFKRLSQFLFYVSIAAAALKYINCTRCGASVELGPHNRPQIKTLWQCELRCQGGLLAVIESSPVGIDALDPSLRYRVMRLDHSIMGGHWIEPKHAKGQSIFSAFYLQAAIRLLLPEATSRRSLHVGLGVGTAVTVLQNRGFAADVIELHGEIIDVAREFFNVSVLGQIIVADALRAVPNLIPNTYDLAILDVFSGDTGATGLEAEDFFRRLKSTLKTSAGVLAVNVVGTEGLGLKKVVCRLKRVFTIVRGFGDIEADVRKVANDVLRNFVLAATDHEDAGSMDLKEATRREILTLGANIDDMEGKVLDDMHLREVDMFWATPTACKEVEMDTGGKWRSLAGLRKAAVHWKTMRHQFSYMFWNSY